MTTKTITIMEDAYEMLARQKAKGESFSETIRRLSSKKKDISEFFGMWSKEYANEIEKHIEERRSRNRSRAKWREEQFTA